MQRIAWVLLGLATLLAGCQSSPSGQSGGGSFVCSPRVEDSGGQCPNFGTTYTIQQN